MEEEEKKGIRADGRGHPLLFFRRRRFYIAFMASIGYVVSYSTRVNLSVAILYMTKLRNITVGNTTVENREFHWTEDTQGVILSSFFYGYIVSQIPGGYLSGIIGGNHVLNIGVAGSGLVSFMGPLSVHHSIATTIAMRVIVGLFQGVTVPAISNVWARWAPPLERTILSTIAISGNFFSSFIIMPICGVIGDYWGWEWMFYIFGTVSIIWCTIWGFTVFSGPEKDIFIKKSELEYIQKAIGERTDRKPIHPWKKIFSSMAVGAAVISQTGHNWGYYTLLLYGPKYYFETLHLGVRESAIYTGLAFTITGFLMVVCGQLSDMLRRKGIMTTVAVRKLFCCGGFAIQITFMLLLAFIYSTKCSIAFSVLAIGLGGITWSAFNVNPLDIAAPHSAIISGIANTAATLSGIFSPLVASIFLPTHKEPEDWMWIWIICASIYLASGIFFLIFAAGEKQSWVYTPPND